MAKIRSRRELVYLNIDDLTQEEVLSLADLGLNCCDNCGEIDLSENLIWDHHEEFNILPKNFIKSGIIAICRNCFNKKDKIAQCGSCKKYVIVETSDKKCSHCNNSSWIY